jgi:hypothetical protein
MNIQAALVRSILERWQSYTWTVQGFGFARTKIADVGRIHVWDSMLATPRVSTMHTHPWPLRSTIISGELINQRYDDGSGEGSRLLSYQRSRIATGEGGGLVGSPEVVNVFAQVPEHYIRGQSYEQQPEEIHRTIAQDGTVTLIERPQGPPLEEALVYWPAGTEWVSAEPRVPEKWQLANAIEYALRRWMA